MEQKLALIFADKTKRTVLERLQEEGVIRKSELNVWLKDIGHANFIDINSLVSSLIKEGLAREVSIKAAPSAMVFLIRDIIITRTPPSILIKEGEAHGLPAAFENQYLAEIKTFFKGYKPTLEDNIKLAELLIDPQFFEGLELLRTAIVSRDDLEKLKKKGVDDVDALLKKFWDNKLLITLLRDESKKVLFALIADITLERCFPTYLFNLVRKHYAEKSKSNPVLLEHLTILKDVFWETQAQT